MAKNRRSKQQPSQPGTPPRRPPLAELWFGPTPPAESIRLSARQQDVRFAGGLLAVPVLTATLGVVIPATPLATVAMAAAAFLVGAKLLLDMPLFSAKAMLPIGTIASVLLARGEQMLASLIWPNGLFG